MIKEFLISIALVLLKGVSKLPYSIVKRCGELAGLLAWKLAKSRRRIAKINLEICFPNLDAAQREKIAREHFKYYGRSFFERFIFWYGSEQRVQALVQIEGLEILQASKGKPTILLAPHFLGLDAGGIRVESETQIVSIYAKQSSPALTKATIEGRSRFNSPVLIARQDGLLVATRLLKAGTPLYFLPDMDLGGREAVFAPFFGKPAATVTSVARLTKITGAQVIACVTKMTSHGYVIRFYPAWQDFPFLDHEAAARYMNEFIEQRILEAPAQYLWTHRRFKTRPNAEASPYQR
jgi:Kdo2-lipid IVA lauroyltransferase/acyltransferase